MYDLAVIFGIVKENSRPNTAPMINKATGLYVLWVRGAPMKPMMKVKIIPQTMQTM